MLISDYVPSNLIIWFFDLIHFRELGQQVNKFFCSYLVQMKTLKFASEIYWPLPWVRILLKSQNWSISKRGNINIEPTEHA